MKWHETTNDTVHDDNNIKGFFDDYRYLSNFHPCPVMFKGLLFKSSETAYQAAKSDDQKVWVEFIDLEAGEAKRKGKVIRLREDWKDVKLKIMYHIVLDKFLRNEDLRAKLLETGEKYLEETNWWNDKYWGVCKGVGENHLGRILMLVRDNLKAAKDANIEWN